MIMVCISEEVRMVSRALRAKSHVRCLHNRTVTNVVLTIRCHSASETHLCSLVFIHPHFDDGLFCVLTSLLILQLHLELILWRKAQSYRS